MCQLKLKMYHYKEGNLNLAEEVPVYFLPLAYRETVSFMSKSQIPR